VVVADFAGADGTGDVDGSGSSARFNSPVGIVVDTAGNAYVTDLYNDAIRKITPAGVVSTLAGGNPITSQCASPCAVINSPWGVALDAFGNLLSYGAVDYISSVPTSGTVSYNYLFNRPSLFATTQGSYHGALAVETNQAVYLTNEVVYLTNKSSCALYQLSSTGNLSVLAGNETSCGYVDGTGSGASFAAATFATGNNIVVDQSGNVFLADGGNNAIRKITPSGVVTTFAGSSTAGYLDGAGSVARFSDPSAIAIDSAGNLYVMDTGNNLIRLIAPSGQVSTLAGTPGVYGWSNGAGTSATFDAVLGLAVDSAGNVYVVESDESVIRKVSR